MSKLAIYPGTFDPVTNGHIDIVKRAVKMFDRVIVLLANNQSKTPMFKKEERLEMLKETLTDIPNVNIEAWDGFVSRYVVKTGACAIIRGIRAVTDFDYEFQLALANKKLGADTVFLPTNKDYMFLSSSMVRQISFFGGDISDFVPKCVEKRMKERNKA